MTPSPAAPSRAATPAASSRPAKAGAVATTLATGGHELRPSHADPGKSSPLRLRRAACRPHWCHHCWCHRWGCCFSGPVRAWLYPRPGLLAWLIGGLPVAGAVRYGWAGWVSPRVVPGLPVARGCGVGRARLWREWCPLVAWLAAESRAADRLQVDGEEGETGKGPFRIN
jgi:hypothetical protein